MKLKLSEKLFCRTPVFVISGKPGQKWDEFKAVLRESSPEFHRLIEEMPSPGLDVIINKVDYTVWKYFNRARYRATPYGRFAAITSLKISDLCTAPVTLSDHMIVHRFNDWTEKEITASSLKFLLKNSQWFFTNSTTYCNSDEHRYNRIVDGVFETSMVGSFPEMDAVLNFCFVIACRTI